MIRTLAHALLFAAAFLAAFLLVAPRTAFAQTAAHTSPSTWCEPRDDLLEKLASQYGERPVAAGLADTGGVVEVLAQPDDKSWTIIVTRPDGVACIAATGEAWHQFPINSGVEG